MKIKYLILRATGSHGSWSYMGKERDISKKPITTSHFSDRFLCIDVLDAVKFNSYEDAETFISNLGMINAIFKIEKIYIIE